jgi:hypothetical protein
MAAKKPSLYLISILLFMLILPVVSIAFEWGTLPAWRLIGKWFVFWAVGVRLFIAGVRQVAKPEFTAKDIFHIDSRESLVIVRELGFANLSIGLAGILSLLKTGWTEIAAISGGLFFGLAGLLHVLKKRSSTNEVIAMISDLFIFLVIILYLLFTSIM